MANKDNQSQRFIYIRSLKEKVPCTEQQFQEFYREATRIRKKEQYYHRCKCPKQFIWACDGDCDNCEHHLGYGLLSLDAPNTEDGSTLLESEELAFVVIDYLTGVMCAINDRTLSSEVGFKGICRKVLIFLLVGIAHILDVNVIGSGGVLRTAVIFFYISNEGVSLFENAAHLGLPVPEKIKVVLEQLHDRSESKEE